MSRAPARLQGREDSVGEGAAAAEKTDSGVTGVSRRNSVDDVIHRMLPQLHRAAAHHSMPPSSALLNDLTTLSSTSMLRNEKNRRTGVRTSQQRTGAGWNAKGSEARPHGIRYVHRARRWWASGGRAVRAPVAAAADKGAGLLVDAKGAGKVSVLVGEHLDPHLVRASLRRAAM